MIFWLSVPRPEFTSLLLFTFSIFVCSDTFRKEAALKKKREEQEKREAEITRKYLEKQEEENRRTAAAERRIRELEKVERDMIERLKKTQTLQQKVSVLAISHCSGRAAT